MQYEPSNSISKPKQKSPERQTVTENRKLQKAPSPKQKSPKRRIEEEEMKVDEDLEEAQYEPSEVSIQKVVQKQEKKKKEPKRAKSAMFIPVDSMAEADKDDLYINMD